MAIATTRIRVALLDEIIAKGVVVVQAGDRPVAVFADGGKAYAVDNRCPHMGFPLSRGTVKDCTLTCHWHQARFDLASGSTFDPFADDIPAFDTFIEAGVVFIAPEPREKADAAYHLRRLKKGLEDNIGLITAKSLLGLLDTGSDPRAIIREIAGFALPRSESTGQGLTILAIVGGLLDRLSAETAYFALYRAATQVAADYSGTPPRRSIPPLATSEHPQEKLDGWFRFASEARSRDGAMRVLMTSLARNATDAELTHQLAGAETDRIYAGQGHPFDGINKVVELARMLDAPLRAGVYPLAVDGVIAARGREEDAGWHHPIEIVKPLREAEARIPALLEAGRGRAWTDDGSLVKTFWEHDPLAIVAALERALASGAPPAELAKRAAYAAALRLARFAPTNEVGDWFNPQHTFIYANAVHQAVGRAPTPLVVRGIFHAALAVYMDRFLNVPPAALPGADLGMLPQERDELCRLLLASFDQRAEWDVPGKLVARYLRLGHPLNHLVDALMFATVREDLDFHTVQVLEAGVRQAEEWRGRPEAEHILIGVVRQLASFCPTRRAGLQTATIARRLHHHEKVFEEA